jgi:uncharacterized BrkB/YihY/UPF0761 family membrane protein
MSSSIYTNVEHVVHYATLGSVIRTILWIIFISYILRLIARMSVQYAMNKTQEELDRQMRQNQAPKDAPKKASKEPIGEYVDYIEIKD